MIHSENFISSLESQQCPPDNARRGGFDIWNSDPRNPRDPQGDTAMTSAVVMERAGMGMTGMGTMGGTGTMPTSPQWMMVPRCQMTMEKCKGGMKITCKCDDAMSATMLQNLCSMMAGGMCSCCMMMNGMMVCSCNMTMGMCKCDQTKDGVCITCTSGDADCCAMIQACCDCMSAMSKAGCVCCLCMNNMPVCCTC